jgi:hypothetical protein
MRRLFPIALFCLFVCAANSEDVTLKSIRPSKLLAILAGGPRTPEGTAKLGRLEGRDNDIIPKGITLIAHDTTGKLTIEGPDSAVAEVKKIIALLDVESRQLELTYELNCDVDHQHTKTETNVKNNTSWSSTDGATGITAQFRPRINSDSTISCLVSISRGTQQVTFVTLLKEGATLVFKLTDLAAFRVIGVGTTDSEWQELGKRASNTDLDEPEAILSFKISTARKSGRRQ